MTDKPTPEQVKAALDVIARATGAKDTPSAEAIAKMTPAELAESGLTSEQMFAAAAAAGGTIRSE